jgi:hypothetical protein
VYMLRLSRDVPGMEFTVVTSERAKVATSSLSGKHPPTPAGSNDGSSARSLWMVPKDPVMST